jgi:ribosomal protein S18 acetylase RimI-like enzyme
MTYQIFEMTPADYEESLDLWKRCEGIGLSDADEKEPVARFLAQNKGLCFIARAESKLVGTCLTGSDGRRGYLYHLAVDPSSRREGIAKALVQRAFTELQARDIHKCHIMVYGGNELGLKFWKQTGWVLRPEIVIMSYDLKPPCGGSPC